MNNIVFRGVVMATILGSNLVNAQSFGLQSAGQRMLSEVAGAFPYVAGVLFIYTGWKALDEYTQTKDTMAALKIVMWYILAVLVIVGGYQFVKSQSL